MLKNVIGKLLGSANDRIVKSYDKVVSLINDLEPKYHAMSDEELRAQTDVLRKRLADGEKEKNILPDAFAAVREAAKRSIGLRHFNVQLIGGMVLNNGQIAEMKTGEGKTLVATLALYLKALHGKGAHLITVNDYLASRDAEWMGQVYRFLGMTVGIIQHDMTDDERRNAYACDITYVTNSELGFDYLRDNMKFSKAQQVLRPLFYAIVDEVDSILIDEARTPLIISGPAEDTSELYEKVDAVVAQLGPNDYKKDEKDRHVTLTEAGVDTATRLLKDAGLLVGDNLYASENAALVMHIQQSLLAHHLYQKNVNYVVRDGEILIVDEFTGRVMTGRRFGKGLHQAIEAKEHVKVQPENQTVSSISYQNLFRLYPTLSGMTGTAMTEAAEFEEIYKLRVVSIPTNRPVARIDHHDEIYRNKDEKYDAIIKQIEDCMSRKQPVLVGTVSIEKSEELAAIVRKRLGINPAVLNAKHHESEAKIVAQAGAPGAVTIATNMAGRGTDIKLGGNAEELIAELSPDDPEFDTKKQEIYDRIEANKRQVLDAGGLYVIGTERHESRRIDNQLRGRAGRQGDPGDSKFFLALDDDLMRIFGAARLQGMLTTLGLKPGEAITHPWITKALEKAQKRVEARYFESRKELLKYDDVMNEQRGVVYKQRDDLMVTEDLSPLAREMIGDVVEMICENNIPEKSHPADWNTQGIHDAMLRVFALDITDIEKWKTDETISERRAYETLYNLAMRRYGHQAEKYGPELMQMASRQMMLGALDSVWKRHLQQMDYLQTAIGLRGYAQKNPLYEYKREALELFKNTINNFKIMSVSYICRMELTREDVAATEKERAQHDASLNDAGEARRNAPCPCGSGLKYKHCHGKLK
ncbi:MAG TPA: preprotein translocase subunit SecA [Candidatus Enterousia intestinigallinarum]|uniref:Protein translocase subunit SecA n=1 Tax=Candidatus Enterousia intestinigallinarum TaxID=2840790 RepID=A0A9D1JWZ3_9PROT|nr:preprotein translocase subunit SecA [Candidatus Enterousia intestinigallinarum]